MAKGGKSRKKLKIGHHRKGISRFFQEFKIGEKVIIDIDPSSQNGMPHHRFQGKIGSIIEKRGNAYLVKVKDKFKEKIIIALPQHLRRLT
ncbi:MAG: 50S ribosomal protein L21e [Candidatus Aenigmatarchaeota archaeon]